VWRRIVLLVAHTLATVTNPWNWYSDREVWALEQERIFARSWQYVGHAGMVERPGDFFAASAGRIPIVVTHAEDGETRAFVNVCRHRGSTVAEGAGNRRTLQCPYHAWTYGLDGRLRAAPRADFDVGEVGLAQVRLERWGLFLFVNPDEEATSLSDTLGDVPAQVAALGLDVDALRFHHRSEWSVAANWKVVCENFLECYHCAVAHPSFTALVDVSPDAYRLEVGELYSTQIGPARDGDLRSQFHFVWPNTGINIFPGEPNLSIGPIVPASSPERTDRFLDYFFGPEVEEPWISELLQLDDQVGREDTALVERVQRGVASGVLAEGRLLGDAERLVAHFQRLVRETLTG
jgi:phenylpropionate dioxygenase-like ring-hydroxylating dioxygenase large terminal subunit